MDMLLPRSCRIMLNSCPCTHLRTRFLSRHMSDTPHRCHLLDTDSKRRVVTLGAVPAKVQGCKGARVRKPTAQRWEGSLRRVCTINAWAKLCQFAWLKEVPDLADMLLTCAGRIPTRPCIYDSTPSDVRRMANSVACAVIWMYPN
jgi:hypothetical protein